MNDALAQPALAIGPLVRRAYTCQCGKPVFFPNSQCLACGTPLGYEPERGRLWPLKSTEWPGLWRAWPDAPRQAPLLARYANLHGPAACNWLVRQDDPVAGRGLCRACRLNRTIPALDDPAHPDNGELWGRMEQAKRRLVQSCAATRDHQDS